MTLQKKQDIMAENYAAARYALETGQISMAIYFQNQAANLYRLIWL